MAHTGLSSTADATHLWPQQPAQRPAVSFEKALRFLPSHRHFADCPCLKGTLPPTLVCIMGILTLCNCHVYVILDVFTTCRLHIRMQILRQSRSLTHCSLLSILHDAWQQWALNKYNTYWMNPASAPACRLLAYSFRAREKGAFIGCSTVHTQKGSLGLTF